MGYSIFDPQVSAVSHDIGGKTILVYGNNGLGKTKQACRLPKPFYIPFERGINAIAGVPYLPANKWSDAVKVIKEFTNPLTVDKARQLYQTIIWDTAEASYLKCEEYICAQYGVTRIKDGK